MLAYKNMVFIILSFRKIRLESKWNTLFKISQSVNLLGEYLRALENDIDSLGKHKCKPFVKNETEEQFYNSAEKFN